MRVKHLAIIAAALATTVGVTARADSINNYMEVKEGDEQVLTHRFVPCRRHGPRRYFPARFAKIMV